MRQITEPINQHSYSGFLKAFTILLFMIIYSPDIFNQQQVVITDPEVQEMTFYGETPALRDMPLQTTQGRITRTLKTGYTPKDWILHETVNPNALPKGEDPALQKTYPSSNQLANLNLIRDFDGQGYTFVNPADPIADVGPNHVVQMVNQPSGSTVNIYDKTGNLLVGPFEFDITVGFPDNGRGDPIVVYDALADRWLLSEFAAIGNILFVAISQTPDPTGAYYLYSFPTPNFPDYPKYGVWNDAYFVTTNESGPSAVYALDKNSMLIGNAATSQRFTIPDYPTIGFQATTPVTHDTGTPPPAGAPGMVMRMADDAWSMSITNDRLEIWEIDPDFVVPANSTFTGPTYLATAPFDTELCGYTSFNCFGQPGGGTGLDPLREVLMNRIQYRNFGTHEAIVCNHVTDAIGMDVGGIRWYELRRTGGIANPWSIFQQGTWAPDNLSRWMAGIAINAVGDIGLLYNVVDDISVYPGLRFTGRSASDPPGTMTSGETVVINGTASNASNRYGDYNSLDTDPANELSFWGTGMYNTASTWSTRIVEFGRAASFSVTCPANTNLGTYDCNDIASLPPLPTNQMEAAAAPYNIVSVASTDGTVLVSSSDDMIISACGTVSQTITRTVFIWDDLPGGTPGVFDPGVEESGSCTFTYIYNPDVTSPTITCPPNTSGLNCNDLIPTAATTAQEFTSLLGGMIMDDCTTDLMDFTVTHMDDDNMGTNCPGDARIITRTYTVTDACGNPSMCTQTITYAIKLPPTLICPSTETFFIDPGVSDFEYVYDVMGNAECNPNPMITQLQGPASGSLLGIGSTTVFEYQIDDGCQIVTCMWEVTIEEAGVASGAMTCNDRINTSLGSDCALILSAGLFLEGPFGPSNDFTFMINGVEGNMITECGTYAIMVMDPNGNNACNSTLVVEDKLGPVFPEFCTRDVPCEVSCATDHATIIADASAMVEAAIFDCQEFEFTGPSKEIRKPIDCNEPDTLVLIYSAIDAKGNQSIGEYYYVLLPIDLSMVTFPGTYTGDCTSAGYPEETGEPTVGGLPLIFNGGSKTSQVCNVLATYTDNVLPACADGCENSRKIIRTFTLIDWCTDRIETGDQVIHLKDQDRPTTEKFGEGLSSVDPWTCQVDRYLLPELDASDNCTPDNQVHDPRKWSCGHTSKTRIRWQMVCVQCT